jgi:hypothetical protein
MKRTPIPRSPYAMLGGYLFLPRLIDKARLARKKILHGYRYKTKGFDKLLLRFLRIDGDTFEAAANELDSDEAILKWLQTQGVTHTQAEIEAWNLSVKSMRPDTPTKWAQFNRALKEAGGEDGKVATYFELIELEDKREAVDDNIHR